MTFIFKYVVIWLTVTALSLIQAVSAFGEDAAASAKETEEQRDARMAWWREATFGMFIHWGVYSAPAGEWQDKKDYGEWLLEDAKIPVSRYEEFRTEFNPVKFNAEHWVALAKDAGMKYIVVTCKHHDGFAMFDTKLTDWGIKSTPYAHDPIRDLAAACQKAGIKFCVYYSVMDWHHPDYAPRRAWNDVAKGDPDINRYLQFMKGQLKELLTNYGPVGLLWFDGEWETSWTDAYGKDIYAYVRSLQPNIIVNNRLGKNRPQLADMGMEGIHRGGEMIGDYDTPEQKILADTVPNLDWETAMTMNEHWGYNKNDQNWKSLTTLIRNLIDIASKGGNYLLNVGPTAEGLIPEPSVERLREMGKWMKVNGQAVYGTTSGPFPTAPVWGRVTQKPGKLFLHVFDWPKDGKLTLEGIPGKKATAAYLLADANRTPLALAANEENGDIELSLPAPAPDPIASVIVLNISE